MAQIEQAHRFADAYRERFDIPSGHLFLMLNYKANTTNGADEDWYEFVQRTPSGGFVARYWVYSAYRGSRPSKNEHVYRIYNAQDQIIKSGDLDSINPNSG